MTVVINTIPGSFQISDEIKKKLNIPADKEDFDYRLDQNLIDSILEFGSYNSSGQMSMLGLVEIPDNATDWVVEEAYGQEWIVYVVDGHLYKSYGEIRRVT